MHCITWKSAVLLLAPVAVVAYKDGPPPDMSGAGGGTTCAMCHQGNPLNDPAGSLKVTGLPDSYAAGRTYRVTVALARAGLRTGGFQMTARTASGEAAGSWRALDEDRVQAISGTVQHTEHGTRAPGEGENRWELEWTAPGEGSREVVFNAAANASNDDASALGDYVYTVEARVVFSGDTAR